MTNPLKKKALETIDPFRAVDILGHRWLTFTKEETLVKADELLKAYLDAHKTEGKKVLDYLYHRDGKTQAEN